MLRQAEAFEAYRSPLVCVCVCVCVCVVCVCVCARMCVHLCVILLNNMWISATGETELQLHYTIVRLLVVTGKEDGSYTQQLDPTPTGLSLLG